MEQFIVSQRRFPEREWGKKRAVFPMPHLCCRGAVTGGLEMLGVETDLMSPNFLCHEQLWMKREGRTGWIEGDSKLNGQKEINGLEFSAKQVGLISAGDFYSVVLFCCFNNQNTRCFKEGKD